MSAILNHDTTKALLTPGAVAPLQGGHVQLLMPTVSSTRAPL